MWTDASSTALQRCSPMPADPLPEMDGSKMLSPRPGETPGPLSSMMRMSSRFSAGRVASVSSSYSSPIYSMVFASRRTTAVLLPARDDH
ncbi:hypothetical protein D3C71_1754650 [compost metagenome]